MNRISKLTLTSTLLVTSLAALPARTGFAESCGFPAPDNNASGDALYGPNICSDAKIKQYWNDLDFDEGDWDEGFGYSDVCNINLPLARTFNALWVLENSAPGGRASSGNLLQTGYNFTKDNIDELDGVCHRSYYARTYHFPVIVDEKTELSYSFFYDVSAPERAGTLVHEARHANGKGHSADDDECPRGGSCDTHWEDWGANTYHVTWLWWFVATGVNTTPALKDLARDKANYILSAGYRTPPGFRI